MKKIFKVIGNLMSWLILALVAIITVNSLIAKSKGEVPKIFGYSMYVVATGSMEPSIKVGDVILAKIYDDQELKEGQVITYKGLVGSYNGKLVTHELIEIDEETGMLTTKGTANNIADPLISKDQVVSIMVCKLPIVSFIFEIVEKPIGFIILIFLPLAYLVIVEMLNLRQQIKEKKEEEKDETKEAE